MSKPAPAVKPTTTLRETNWVRLPSFSTPNNNCVPPVNKASSGMMIVGFSRTSGTEEAMIAPLMRIATELVGPGTRCSLLPIRLPTMPTTTQE